MALDVKSPLDLVYECFAKLGLRYICVVKDGKYAGMVSFWVDSSLRKSLIQMLTNHLDTQEDVCQVHARATCGRIFSLSLRHVYCGDDNSSIKHDSTLNA